jgi:hypothetical protein
MNNRTYKNMVRSITAGCPSERHAKIAIAKELVMLGVPTTRVSTVVDRIWRVLSPMGNTAIIPAADGHWASAGVTMRLWSGDWSSNIRRAMQSWHDTQLHRRDRKRKLQAAAAPIQ